VCDGVRVLVGVAVSDGVLVSVKVRV
jgi:hypothetical protein